MAAAHAHFLHPPRTASTGTPSSPATRPSPTTASEGSLGDAKPRTVAIRTPAPALRKFFYQVVDAQITFVADDQKHVTTLILHQNGQDQEAKRIK